MSKEDIVKELSNYSKEAIILAISKNMFFRSNEIVNAVKFNEAQLLLEQISRINEESKQIQVKNIESSAKWQKLHNKWRRLNNKLDSLWGNSELEGKENGRI